MKVLFNAFIYKDETYNLIQAGALHPDDVDEKKDCDIQKIIVDTDMVCTAEPHGDKNEMTYIVLKTQQRLTLKYPFVDYVRLTNPLSAGNFAATRNT